MLLRVLICLIIGYVCGTFESGYFLGKIFYGIDIRNYGSGNPGTSNTVRTLGKAPGYLVFAGDVIKVVFAVHLVRFVLFAGLPVTNILGMITGFGAVLGHSYPPYLHFKGGKGMAVTGGVMLAFDWRMAAIATAVFLVIFFITRYMSVVSLTLTLMFPFMMLFFYPRQWSMFALAWPYTIFVWIRHRENIKRLRNGTENKFVKKSKKKKNP